MQNRKDSVVKLYDYYKPEQSLLQFYKVVNNCSVDSIEGLQDNGLLTLKKYLTATTFGIFRGS